MIKLPDNCLRDLDNCEPYSQVQSDCKSSFFCCGKNNGEDRTVEQDEFTLCFVNNEVDEHTYNDKRDLLTFISVMSNALMIDEEMKGNDNE